MQRFVFGFAYYFSLTLASEAACLMIDIHGRQKSWGNEIRSEAACFSNCQDYVEQISHTEGKCYFNRRLIHNWSNDRYTCGEFRTAKRTMEMFRRNHLPVEMCHAVNPGGGLFPGRNPGNENEEACKAFCLQTLRVNPHFAKCFRCTYGEQEICGQNFPCLTRIKPCGEDHPLLDVEVDQQQPGADQKAQEAQIYNDSKTMRSDNTEIAPRKLIPSFELIIHGTPQSIPHSTPNTQNLQKSPASPEKPKDVESPTIDLGFH